MLNCYVSYVFHVFKIVCHVWIILYFLIICCPFMLTNDLKYLNIRDFKSCDILTDKKQTQFSKLFFYIVP